AVQPIEKRMSATELAGGRVMLERHSTGLLPPGCEHLVKDLRVILAQRPRGDPLPEGEGLPGLRVDLRDELGTDRTELLAEPWLGDRNLLRVHQQVAPEPDGEQVLAHDAGDALFVEELTHPMEHRAAILQIRKRGFGL